MCVNFANWKYSLYNTALTARADQSSLGLFKCVGNDPCRKREQPVPEGQKGSLCGEIELSEDTLNNR